MMDRKISPDKLRKRRIRLYMKIASLCVAISVALIVLSHILRPSVPVSGIEISVAQKGTLDISIGANGTVVPFYEEVISSPITTKILEVYKKSGEEIKRGDTILRLDLSTAKVDFQAEQDDIEIQKYQLEQCKVNAHSQLKDLEMQIKIDEMKLKRMEVLLINEYYLDSIGASTQDKVRQSKLEYEVSKLQFEQLTLKLANLKATAESDLKVRELNYKKALNRFSIRKKTIGEAQITSPRDATLSWVNDQVGASVATGAQLATLSDLSRFKVNTEISDSYAGKFSTGNKVAIKLGSRHFTGNLVNIVPSVHNGRINFTVLLDDDDNDVLRSGLKVDVYVINSVKDDVVKITKRSYYSGPGEYSMWVINNNIAEKRKVILGESGSSEVEVTEGINPGERVIVSNMNRHENRNKLHIR